MIRKAGFLLGILGMLTGCGPERVYEDFEALPQGWAVKDTVRFRFALEHSPAVLDFVAQFRCDASYPYNNLYYYLYVTDLRDSILYSGLEEVLFFEPKTGRPLGSGLGDLFTVEQNVLDAWEVSADSLTVSVVQYMRLDTLQGIDRVGLLVSPHEEED